MTPPSTAEPFPSAAEDHALDALALAQLAPLSGRFLPWTPYSMRPAAIADIVSEAALRDHALIVECGSGNSTVFLARLLAQRAIEDARVVSLESDAVWAELTRAALESEGLTHLVDVIDAPLADDGWYARGAIPELVGIDLLVVDGPTAFTEATRRSREPALDHFAGRLAAGATVVLDDARRSGEQEVLAAWTERHSLEFEVRPGGHAVSVQPLG